MNTKPILSVKLVGSNSNYMAYKVATQDEKVIPRGAFTKKIGAFTFASLYAPEYNERLQRIYLLGTSVSQDDNVLLVPSWLAGSFIEAVAALNESMTKRRIVVFRYAAGSKPDSIHEVEVDSEDYRYICGTKRGDDGGYRKYLKKNIVGGKIVEL